MELDAWLRGLGLDRYAEMFRINEVDWDQIPELTDGDLEKLGLPLGPRKRILKAIAEFGAAVPAAPTGAPTSIRPETEADRRQLTVMFCDLVGSTALSARLDPEDLRALIASYHASAAAAIERFGGRVAQYLGDGVMAYFGHPHAHEDDAERAVRAALAVVEGVTRLQGAEKLQVRVGIATGLVVTGEIGSGAAQLSGALGETPNLAARMQALAEPGAIVIDVRTRRLLGDLFEYRDLGAAEVKGFTAPVETFAVLSSSSHQSRFEALHGGGMTPLVGREDEIELLLRRWHQANSGEGQVVLLGGEPGIGKSRLIAALLERIGGEPHLQLRYFCSAHHQDSALYPVIDQLERAAEMRRDDAAEARLAKLEALLARGSAVYRDDLPLVANLLSIPLSDRYRPLDLSAQKRCERTLKALVTQVEGLSRDKPLLVVFEDLHWADPTTRDLLDLVVDCVATLPVFLVLTFRPEFQPPWIGQPHVSLVSLNRLSPRQRAQMIERVTGGKGLPTELVEQIAQRTDGVPLFVEELTKSVLESGMVVDAGHGYAMTGAAVPMAIPTTLQASLMARLDRLAPVREVAQIGAALGRQFPHELITAVAELPPVQLIDALDQLISAELIYRRGRPPEAEYTFKHALVQDAAYDSLLKSRRQQLHARIASVLEKQFPEIIASQPDRVAHHCTEAGLIEKAAGYWFRAGGVAITRSATREAITHLRKGLAQATTLPNSEPRWRLELQLRNALGQALIATRGFTAPDALEALVDAREVCERLDNPPQLVGVMNGLGFIYIARAEFDRAQAIGADMRALGATGENRLLESMGLYVSGRTHFFAGEFMLALGTLEQALRLYDPSQRSLLGVGAVEEPHAIMKGFLANTLTNLGRIDEGRACRSTAIAEARQLGQSFTLAYVLVMGSVADFALDVRDARDRLAVSEEAEAISRERGYPLFEAFGTISRGWYLGELGHEEAAAEIFASGIALGRKVGGSLWLPALCLWEAIRDAKRGNNQRAMSHLDEAADLVEKTNVRWSESEIYRLRGELLRARGDEANAEKSLLQSIAIARQQSAKLRELRAATTLGHLLVHKGELKEARAILAPVYGWFTEGLDTIPLVEAKALLDQLG